MRRHGALIALSNEHHGELVQARRLLRAAAQGSDDERLAAADAYLETFFAETVDHFRREEEELFPLYRRHAGGTETLERILREHMELHGLARALRAEVAGGSVRAETLRTLGTLLRSHVRLEERELFEAIQQTVPLAELDHLE
jgi:hemerythrin-like domain-containing protein